MTWIADPPTLSESSEETMWDLYRRRQWAGTADTDYKAWCKDRGLDPEQGQNARAYEDWFVTAVCEDDGWWREQGYGL